MGVKPQAEAPHSVLVAPRGALRRRHRPRAQHASVGRCTATSWTDLGVGAHLLRSASASRRAAKGARRSMGNGEIVLSRSVLRCAWSRPQRGGGARGGGSAKKDEKSLEIKVLRASTLKSLLRSPFFRSPGFPSQISTADRTHARTGRDRHISPCVSSVSHPLDEVPRWVHTREILVHGGRAVQVF